LLEEIDGLLVQVRDSLKVHAVRVLEHPGNPLLPIQVGADGGDTGHAARERGRVEEELSSVHRLSHCSQGCHETVQVGPPLDGTRGQLLLGRIDQDEQYVVGPWPVGARFPLIDHPDQALAARHRAPGGCGLHG